MELEESVHNKITKRSRVGNGGLGTKLGCREEKEDSGAGKFRGNGGRQGGAVVSVGGDHAILPWQQNPSSRIYRVSRASGGKDRHSKVYTARGLRDRRVRLSVSTAIQFYDLQDRLGYDQPSKAVEWLIKAAAAAIDDLPSLDGFLNQPNPGGEDKKIIETDPSYNHENQHLSTKSGCSSTSETSKGSVLSLSRPPASHVKAGDRAQEGVPKENGDIVVESHQQNLNPSMHSQTSFTELLTSSNGGGGHGVTTLAADDSRSNCIQKKIFTADYFGQAGLFPQSQSLFGNNSALAMMPLNFAASTTTNNNNNAATAAAYVETPQFSFFQDHLIHVPTMAPPHGDYNLNFPLSSCIAGLTRGTLQSNSPSQLPRHHQNYSHIQRFPSPAVDGSNLPFFFGAADASAASANSEYQSALDGRLKICYTDESRHSDLKGKGKS